MTRKVVSACLLAGLPIANFASAEVGFNGNFGTFGLGAHLSIPIQPQLNARLGINGLQYNFDGSNSGIDYDYKLKLRTFDALLDYFPRSTGFRITGGIAFNGNEVDAVGRPAADGTYTLNGSTYSAATVGSLNGKADFRNIAPYLGIGRGKATASTTDWQFSANLGVLFQGRPRTSLTNTGCTALLEICARLVADVATENVELNNDVDDFKAYPVLRLGVSYPF